MHRNRQVFGFLLMLSMVLLSFWPMAAVAGFKVQLLLNTLKLPPGFNIALYADNVANARSMALSPSGVLFVGSRKAGRVYAVLDQDKDRKADKVIILADNLNMPNGVALWEGDLYVAEVSRILRYERIESRLGEKIKPEVVYDAFPTDRHHGWKFIRFGPDGRLYVPVGAPCNVCRKDNPIYASITRINRDGSGLEIVARGVRNSVGFDWHPKTGQMWFTDNGRDWLGDDLPPDELNRLVGMASHYGFPHCHGGEVVDPKFSNTNGCREFVPPVVKLPAHVAPLGMRFYTGDMFPKAYRNQIFIAEHGSWNRSRKIGYRITMVKLEGNQVVGYEPFAHGWLTGGRAWGRPVDLEVMGDGSMLVSDDKNGLIYRIFYPATRTNQNSGIKKRSGRKKK